MSFWNEQSEAVATKGCSEMVSQWSPKPLAGVRFPPPLPLQGFLHFLQRAFLFVFFWESEIIRTLMDTHQRETNRAKNYYKLETR